VSDFDGRLHEARHFAPVQLLMVGLDPDKLLGDPAAPLAGHVVVFAVTTTSADVRMVVQRLGRGDHNWTEMRGNPQRTGGPNGKLVMCTSPRVMYLH
jgi:hypothetical protein